MKKVLLEKNQDSIDLFKSELPEAVKELNAVKDFIDKHNLTTICWKDHPGDCANVLHNNSYLFGRIFEDYVHTIYIWCDEDFFHDKFRASSIEAERQNVFMKFVDEFRPFQQFTLGIDYGHGFMSCKTDNIPHLARLFHCGAISFDTEGTASVSENSDELIDEYFTVYTQSDKEVSYIEEVKALYELKKSMLSTCEKIKSLIPSDVDAIKYYEGKYFNHVHKALGRGVTEPFANEAEQYYEIRDVFKSARVDDGKHFYSPLKKYNQADIYSLTGYKKREWEVCGQDQIEFPDLYGKYCPVPFKGHGA